MTRIQSRIIICLRCKKESVVYSNSAKHCGKLKDKNGCSYFKIVEASRLYSKNNKIIKKEKEREYRKNNTNFRMANNLRCRLRMALKSQGTLKTNKTMMYIGCTKEYLIKHLQNNFKENMSWDNYGKWHIDHIKPLSRFDLNEEEEIYKAMHYTNLQPLWANENLRKSAYFVD